MKNQKLLAKLAAGVGAAIVLAGITAVVPMATANASTTAVLAPMSAVQKTDEAAVASFSATHVAPILATHATSAQYLAFAKSEADYWNAVPWTSVYGQWGCSVSDVQVSYHATVGSWGEAGAAMSSVSNCLIPQQYGQLIGKVASRTSLLKVATPVSTKHIASPNTVASAGYYGTGTCQLQGTDHSYLCVDMPSTGTLQGTNDYEGVFGTTSTGHIRLGQPGAGAACGLGTFIGNGPTEKLSLGGHYKYTHTVSVDSQWSNRWYDPNFEGGVCGTY